MKVFCDQCNLEILGDYSEHLHLPGQKNVYTYMPGLKIRDYLDEVESDSGGEK